MKKFFGTLLVAAIVVAGLTGCQRKNGEANVGAGELKPVRIATCSATAELSDNALIAHKLGYIEEELNKAGYTADYKGFAEAGPAVNEAFVSKDIDLAVYVEFPAITAKSNGVDIKIISTVNQENNYALLVTEKSGIKTVKDIVGKKIIVTKGTILYKHFIDLCTKNNIDPESVEQLSALSYSNAILASGEADGIIITYPGALMFQTYGLGHVISDTTNDLDLATGYALVGRNDYLKKNPEAAKAIIRAFKRAYEYASADPEQAYELLSSEYLPVPLVKQAYGYNPTLSNLSPKFTDVYYDRAQKVYDFCKENNLLGSEFNLKDLFDTSYLEAVYKEKNN